MCKKILSRCSSRKAGKAERLVLLFYLAGLIIIQCFHEPWFDEAQAWQLARCSTIREVLFTIPHYEGHPQLWHLILYPFAHLGFPFHATISAINIAFCTAAVALLLFRSPFPKWLRCVIPFTYYFFYQYGVVSRPYSLMMLAFMLLAMCYTGRNVHPDRYIGSMCLLCLTSAYGILISGGLCLVWTFEIVKEYQAEKKWNQVLRDKRPYTLFGILVLAVFLAFCIVPAEDIYYNSVDQTFIDRLKKIYMLLMLPSESLVGCAVGYENNYITQSGIIASCVGGAVIWGILLLFTKKNQKLLTFLLPYGMFSLFFILKYGNVHHMGISTLFILFTFWIMLEQPDGMHIPSLFQKLWNGLETPALRNALKTLGVFAVIVQIGYSVYASVMDLTCAYGPTQIRNFIKENHLENRKILTVFDNKLDFDAEENSEWLFIHDDTLPLKHPPYKIFNTNLMGYAVVNLPYFESNTMFPYFNAGTSGIDYVQHVDTSETYKDTYQLWQEIGLPDFVIGSVFLDEIFTPEQLDGVTYYWIDSIEFGNIWKTSYGKREVKIFIRGDLFDEYPQFHVLTYAEEAAKP